MWDRRTVLKTLLALGVSQTVFEGEIRNIPRWKAAYQPLAASNPRKLALLVGANHTGHPADPDLPGCLTDVELQRDLLLYRFGFQPADIVVLTGEKASREGIENAFLEHLLGQAQPGDGIVFHYSGYGSLFKITGTKKVKGLLPSQVTGISKEILSVNPILWDTLMLLGRSLSTDKFTCVLDTSYTKPLPSYPRNFALRSSSLTSEDFNASEFAFQGQIQRLSQNYSKLRASSGTYLLAAQDQQGAAEFQINEVRVGLFTYLLTQYLWQVTSASKLTFTLSQIDQRLSSIMGEKQNPQLDNATKSSLLTYYLLPEVLQGAEGVITQVLDNQMAKVRLSGLPSVVIQEYGVNSLFSLSNLKNSLPNVKIRSRTGLEATIDVLKDDLNLEVGQILLERIRVFPRQIGLSVALDSQLQRIERVDATSALASIKIVQSVHNTGEAYADCILGKTQSGGYGLFTPGGSLIPKTEGDKGEAIKLAVERLSPYFKQQLAFKFYQLTQNEGSSRLAVKVTLEQVDKINVIISQRQTQRGLETQGTSYAEINRKLIQNTPSNLIPEVAQASALQYRLENYSDNPLRVFIIALTPSQSSLLGFLAEETLPPGGTQILSPQRLALNNNLSAALGIYQVGVICSQVPLTQVEKTLSLPENHLSLRPLMSPLATTLALLEDLDKQSHFSASDSNINYHLDVNLWATLHFAYQVVAKPST